MLPDKSNIYEKFNKIKSFWNPGIIGELNGQHVKLGKLKGEFVPHTHLEEDEMFLLIKGSMYIDFDDGSVELEEGDMIVIPRGVRHKPRTQKNDEAWVMLFEPASTINTGDFENEFTKKELELL